MQHPPAYEERAIAGCSHHDPARHARGMMLSTARRVTLGRVWNAACCNAEQTARRIFSERGFKPATPKSRPRRGEWSFGNSGRPVIAAATPTPTSLNGIRLTGEFWGLQGTVGERGPRKISKLLIYMRGPRFESLPFRRDVQLNQ